MKFAWDEKKAAANQAKHGVSFVEAQTAFEDCEALLIHDPDSPENEDRFLLLGLSSMAKMLVVCHCYRESDALIRIISARKATRMETAAYQKRR